ncbi:MAG: phosphonate transporter, ATP-binding protein PhnC [Cyanobacteriota bacterium]|jgi:phosphonate transport system ATP-binding protein
MSDSPWAIALHRVCYQFDQTIALREINCAIAPGERVGIIGSSGAGKSTLLQLLNLSLQPTAGRLELLGQVSPIKAAARRKLQRQIGMIYQDLNLVDRLSVIHNVNAGNLGHWPFWKALASLIYPLDRPQVTQILQQVGIPEKIHARTDRLSGGQQQRVAIARVLMQNPHIVLADEPTASLDRELSHSIMALLCQLCQEQGRTLVISLHDVDLARQYCDRLIGLRQGKILFDAPIDAVTETMLHNLYDQTMMVKA